MQIYKLVVLFQGMWFMVNKPIPNEGKVYRFDGTNLNHPSSLIRYFNAAVPSKNAVSANIKHKRYFLFTSSVWSIHYCGKRLYVHMFDMVDTAFRYGRALIVC